MRNVEIKVFCTAQTKVNREAVREWLDWLGANNYAVPDEESTSDPALLVALAAKRCYMSFEPGLNPNVTKVRRDLTAYLDNVLKSGHGSVLEHACYTFAIEGVSRVFTGEMNRHRAGVGISEGSMRYIRYRDIPYWLPTSIIPTTEETAAYMREQMGVSITEQEEALIRIARKKGESQAVFTKHFMQTEENYARLQEIWKDELAPESKFHGKKQITSMMRRIIPMGVATGGVWTMNLRAIRHILALRSSPAAEEEIAHVFSQIAKIITEKEPTIFADFSQDENGFWVPKYPKV